MSNPARDCCFDPSDDLMPLALALARIDRVIVPIERVETVPLRAAVGRVLGADLTAPISVPPHDNSAVDGYAVFHADLADGAETRLPVTGRIAAGHPLDRAGKRGEALRIFTGAPMPEGPDTVVMQEDTREEDGVVVIRAGVKPGANRRRAGEDVTAGGTILEKGRRLRPQDIGLAASVGVAELPVLAPLRVAVFSTGDEVRDPGQALPKGAIYDANRYTIAAMLEALGAEVTDLGILPDRLEVIRDALEQGAGGHDLLITSGGVSLGDEDHVKAAVELLGGLTFWRLAIKPGRPIALGQVKGVPFIGLPGNPVAAMVTFLCIGRHVALRLAGCPDRAITFRVAAGFDFAKKPGRREWLRARLVPGPDGPVAHKFASDGSGILRSMVDSDGLVVLAEDCAGVAAGDLVEFLPFSEVMG